MRTSNGRQLAAHAINTLNLAEKLTAARGQAMSYMVNQLLVMTGNMQAPKQESWVEKTLRMLTDVGPAAASSAVERSVARMHAEGSLTTNTCRSGDFVTNVRNLETCDASIQKHFTANLERTLLPNFPGMSIDYMLDPKHMVDRECGYPPYVTPAMYRFMYDRSETASRVNDIYPDETWAYDVDIWDVDQENRTSGFEEDVDSLRTNPRVQLEQMMYRADKLCGLGRFGLLLYGFDDNRDFEAPVRGIDPSTGERTADFTPLGLLYLRPFDEYLCFVESYETNPNSPRYGLPKLYNIVFVDATIDANAATVGTRTNRKVHWTRVTHMAEGLRSSPIWGVPRQMQVFNRLLDLRKDYGGSSEMLWVGGHPGIAFEMNPDFAADDVEIDDESIKAEIQSYLQGMQRALKVQGGTIKTLSSNIANPEPHIRVQLGGIAMQKRVPLRIFMGSEEAKLASAQDSLNWNGRVKSHLKNHTKPVVVRQVIDHLILTGVVRPPQNNKYYVGWPDLNSPTNEDKANLALKWSQAMSQYVASGMIHLIKPLDFFTIILGLSPRDAVRLSKAVGMDVLNKVDPSQGAGVNGKRKKTADGDSTTDVREGRQKQKNST